MAEIAEILDRIRRGDRSAWPELVQAQASRLHAIAFAITWDTSLSEDAVQETFLRIVEGRVPRLGDPQAEAYLTRAASRAALDALRRREARARREETFAMTRERESPSPMDLLLSEEARLDLRQAFALLPAETRAALWLHHVEGEGVRGVAKCLACSTSTAWQRIQRGLDRLKEALRKRGLASALVVPMPEILRGVGPQAPPSRLLERLQEVGDSLRPRGGAFPRVIQIGGLIVSGEKIALLLALVLLLVLGAGLWIAGGGSGAKEKPFAGNSPPVGGPSIASRPTAVKAPDRPGPAPVETEGQSAPAGDLKSVQGIVLDRQTWAPIAGAQVKPVRQDPPAVPGAKLEAASGQDGTFELKVPIEMEGAFNVAAEGHSTERFFPLRNRGLAVVNLNPRLAVSGWVLDLDDHPIPGAIVDVDCRWSTWSCASRRSRGPLSSAPRSWGSLRENHGLVATGAGQIRHPSGRLLLVLSP